MTIKELEQQLEIPRATIRFYEKENLIAPKRSDNSYREYNAEDIETLRKIIILRKFGKWFAILFTIVLLIVAFVLYIIK